MKSRKKKMIIAIFVILLTALIFNAIYTWGITFEHNGGFQWSTISLFEDIVTDGYAQVRLGGELNNPKFCIPFVFLVYGIESPPYAINFYISDDTGLLEKIYVQSISIEYVKGQKIDHNLEWERNLKDVDKLPVAVDRRQSCNVRFVGYFINKEGVKIPFDTTKHFEYEPYKWRAYPVRGSF